MRLREPVTLIDVKADGQNDEFVRVTSKETEQMFSQIEEQQAVLQDQIEDSKRLAQRSDQLIQMSKMSGAGASGAEA